MIDLSKPITWTPRTSIPAFMLKPIKDALYLWTGVDARIKFKRSDEGVLEFSVGTDLLESPVSSYSAYCHLVYVGGKQARALIQQNHQYYNLKGKPLVRILAHEIGHAFGLDHSTNPTDIMFPSYDGPLTISTDDRFKFKALYG